MPWSPAKWARAILHFYLCRREDCPLCREIEQQDAKEFGGIPE